MNYILQTFFFTLVLPLPANYTVVFPSLLNLKKLSRILSSNKFLRHLLGHADSDQW